MKTKKNLIIFKLIFLFIFPLILSAQQPNERYLNFSGVVMDSDSLKPIINVYYSLNGRLKGKIKNLKLLILSFIKNCFNNMARHFRIFF